MLIQRKNMIITAVVFMSTVVMSLGASMLSISYAAEGTAPENQVMSVSAANEEFDIVSAKLELAALHADEYVEMSEAEIAERTDAIDEIVLSDLSEEEKNAKLEAMNVYVLEIPEENQAEYVASDGSYVKLNAPKIYYNSTNKYWGIYASGRYTTFPNDINEWTVFWPTVGKKYDIGGYDCYGFVIEDSSGTYSASLKSQKCIISNATAPTSGTQVSSTTKTTGSGKYGIGFQIQDQALIKSWDGFTFTYTYIGYSFGCVGWYTDAFKNYNGNVETVYGHTYDSCEISAFNIGLEAGYSAKDGGSLSANCNLTISNTSKGFTGASSDTNLYEDGFGKTTTAMPYSNFQP